MLRNARFRWILWIAVAGFACAQQPITSNADLARVAQDGFINAGKYENSVLQLTIDMPDAQAAVSSVGGEKLVRLVQIVSAPSSSDKFSFSVLADTLSSYPDLKSPVPYVRSIAHQFEKQGFSIIHEELSRTIDGVPFSGTVMQRPSSQKRKSEPCCNRGVYSAFRFGYILSFAVEASSEQRLDELLSTRVHFGPTSLKELGSRIGVGSGGPSSSVDALRPGGSIKPPRIESQSEPQFPKSDRNGLSAGTVVIRAIVGVDGKLHNPRVTRSLSPGFDAKALEAVQQWTFHPAEKDGHKVAVLIDIEVNFHLSN
jgi:TonB family protein